MSKGRKAKAAADDDKAGGKTSTLKLVLMGVAFMASGAIVGPKVMGGGDAAASSATDASTTTTVEPGPVLSLEAITLNLADGHLLQVGLALELSPEAEVPEASEDDPTHGFAKALDAAIQVLGERTMGELAAGGGREEAKAELAHVLEERTEGEVVGVYFHQFVMQ